MIFLVLAFLILRTTLPHYISPPSSCLLSNFCNHTWIPECGQETLQKDNRMFLDLCDIYEYNCGKKKDYKEVDIIECPKDNATLTEKETSKHPVEKTTADTEKITESTIENPKSASITTSTTDTVSTIITSPTLKSTTVTSSKTAKDSSKCTCSTLSSTTQSTAVTPLTTDSTVSSSSSTHTSASVATTISECTRDAKPMKATVPIQNTDTTVTTKSTEIIITTLSTEETVTSESIEETITTASITENTERTNKDTDDETDTSTDNTRNTEVTEIETIIEDETETEVVETSPLPTCSSYPKDCDRPYTWETTPYGEKRDLFQVLRERFGNKVKILRATTHWPRRVLVKNQDNAFYNGRHRDSNFK